MKDLPLSDLVDLHVLFQECIRFTVKLSRVAEAKAAPKMVETRGESHGLLQLRTAEGS